MRLSAPFLRFVLARRIKAGKEDPARLHERMGQSHIERPHGSLIWLHAASVGEAQSALILINALLESYAGLHILVTTGTRTSAQLMEKRLPERAFHQYVPLDHPQWIKSFLNHWTPDAALWMESELWPNILQEIKNRAIPAALINARLSDISFKRWQRVPAFAKEIVNSFHLILTQTDQDKDRFQILGASNVHTTDNLKYSAPPLPYDAKSLSDLQNAIQNRPLWVYASTHDGEETMAARLHTDLKEDHPELLTIIVPRHPERGTEIEDQIKLMGLQALRRTNAKTLPQNETDIYIADTLGEMGVFYKLSSIACVGRSFSHDGGGGHNLIEPTHFNSAVLTGPNVQFQHQMLEDMLHEDAILQVHTEQDFLQTLQKLLQDPSYKDLVIQKSSAFAHTKSSVIETVMRALKPVLSALPHNKNKAA